jgi:hypothetical protein
MSLVDLLLKIRHKIIEGGARVDMSSDGKHTALSFSFFFLYLSSALSIPLVS